MNPTDIYRRAIQRTFADLYGVSPDTVDVTWTTDGETIIVRCDGIKFTHHILSDPDDDAPEFFSDDDQEPSVIVKLTDDERQQLERAI
jgi:hypothetical protein